MTDEIANKEQYCEQAIEIKKNLEAGFLTLAEMLYYIKNEELYKGKWESFASYLAEMDIKESQASKYIQVYESWILEAGVSPQQVEGVGMSKLYTGLKLLNDNSPEEAIKTIKTLKRDDLRKQVNGYDKCEHEWSEANYKRCVNCGCFHKIMEQ